MDEAGPIVLFTGVQRLARKLRELGYVAACLKAPDEDHASPGTVELWVPYDPGDLPGLDAWARQWPERRRVVGVINRRERRVMEHAVLNQALNRPGIDLVQARTLRDKLLFRKALAATRPHLNPRFEPVDLDAFRLPEIPYPFILKPRNLFKSQMITLCSRRDDWDRARMEVTAIQEETGQRHGVQVEGPFLAEAYLTGKEVSLDAFVTHDGQVIPTPAVELTPARGWEMEDFHVAVRYLPSNLSHAEEMKVIDAVTQGVEALRLVATPLHVDLVLVHGDPIILEMGPRIGGYRSEMMELAYGCPLDSLNLDLALGRPVRWTPRWVRGVAVVELFPPRPGRLMEIRGLDRVRGLPSFHRARQRTPTGERVGWARHGFRCPLFVVLHHDDPRIVRQDVERIRTLVQMVIEPLT